MSEIVKIYRGKEIIHEFIAEDSFSRSWGLMSDNYISITLKAKENVLLLYGDYILLDGEKFTLFNAVNVTESNGIKEYPLTFYGEQHFVNRCIVEDEGATTFSYFGTISLHMALVKLALDKNGLSRFTLGIIEENGSQLIQYDNTKGLDAINKICEAFKMEWEFAGDIINIKKRVGVDTSYRFEYGKGKGAYSVSLQPIQNTSITTRVIAKGGTINLPKDYPSTDNPKRLNLGSEVLDRNTDKYGIIPEVMINEEIYPRLKDNPAGGIWDIGAFNITLQEDVLYSIYAKCNQSNSNGIIHVSKEKIDIEAEVGYYYFFLGTISSIFEEARSVTLVTGYTFITGGYLTGQVLQDAQRRLVIDMPNATITAREGAKIRGKVEFESADGEYIDAEIATDEKASSAAITAAQNQIDNLQIGATNLFDNTQHPDVSNPGIWNYCNGADLWGEVGSFTAIKITQQWGRLWQSREKFEAGVEYTFSCFVKRDATIETTETLMSVWKDGGDIEILSATLAGQSIGPSNINGLPNIPLRSDEFEQLIFTFRPLKDVSTGYIRVEFFTYDWQANSPCGVVYAYMLTKGNKNTIWNPSIGDQKRQASDIAEDKINGIKVGATNILKGSYTGNGWSGYTTREGTEYSLTSNRLEESNYIYSGYINIEGDKDIVVSFEAKCTDNIKECDFHILPDDYSALGLVNTVYDKTLSWKRFDFKFRTPITWEDNTLVRMRIDHNGVNDGNDGTIWIRNIQIEYGNVSSSYSIPQMDQEEANKGKLFIRGTGLNRHADREFYINGSKENLARIGRGLNLITIDRQTLNIIDNVVYDTHSSEVDRQALVDKLNNLTNSVIVTLTSCDSTMEDTRYGNGLGAATARCGGSGAWGATFGYRIPYAFIGIPGIGAGNGIEVYTNNASDAPYAEISTTIVRGIPTGMSNASAILANIVKATLEDYSSDNKISPPEKTGLRQLLNEIQAEYENFSNTAGRLAIKNENESESESASEWINYKSAYNAAVAALNKYTASSPEIINIEADYANIADYQEKKSILSDLLELYLSEFKIDNKKIDGSGLEYDQNKYYPVLMRIIGQKRATFSIVSRLGESGIPGWATHPNGFTCECSWSANGNAWGTIPDNTYIHSYATGWTDGSLPIGDIGQFGHSSNECIYVRGGGTYYISTTNVDIITLYSERTEIAGEIIDIKDSVTAPEVSVDKAARLAEEAERKANEVNFLKNAFSQSTVEIANGVVMSGALFVENSPGSGIASAGIAGYTPDGFSKYPMIFAGATSANEANESKVAIYKDGDGWLANKNIIWDENGNLTIRGTIYATSGEFIGKIQSSSSGARIAIDPYSEDLISGYDSENRQVFALTFARKDNSLRINRLVGLVENWVTR